HERALNRAERANPRVAALELLADQAVAARADAGAAVADERRAEQAELAESRDQVGRKRAGRPVFSDRRHDLRRDQLANRVAHHALFVGVQLVDGVIVEGRIGHGASAYKAMRCERYTSARPRTATPMILAIAMAIAVPARADDAALLGDAFRAYDASDLGKAQKLLAKIDDGKLANTDYIAWLRGMVALRTGDPDAAEPQFKKIA